MLNHNDIFAYLSVLQCSWFWRLNVEEQQKGKKNVLGCLVRLYDQLRLNPQLLYIENEIKEREYLNGIVNLPVNHPTLLVSNEKVGEVLWNYLRHGTITAMRPSDGFSE